jgi:hypothetical protein
MSKSNNEFGIFKILCTYLIINILKFCIRSSSYINPNTICLTEIDLK